MELGKRIKELREQKGVSQPQLAEFLGVSFKTVSSWEVGRTEPNMGMLIKLARFFDTSIDELSGDTSIPVQSPSTKKDSVTPILRYSSNDKINSIIKDLLNTDVADGDLDVIRAILNKYSISQPPVNR